MAEERTLRLEQLDSVRAIAVLLVLVEHFSGFAEFIPIGAGTLGVGVFFALSGFLITSLLLAEKARSDSVNLGRFWLRRAARLMPPFYLCLLILAVFHIGSIDKSWPWHAAYLSNFHQIMSGEDTVFWTLAVENQFYLLWPLVILFVRFEWSLAAAIGLTLLSVVSKAILLQLGYWPRHELPTNQAEVLGIGCMLAVISFRNGKPFDFSWMTRRVTACLIPVGVVGFLAAGALWYATRGVYHSYPRLFLLNAFCAVAYISLIAFSARGIGGKVGALISNPAIRYIGTISYGIYLFHTWIALVFKSAYPAMPRPVLGIVVIVLTILISSASWHLLEMPIQRWAKRRTGTRQIKIAPSDPTHAKSGY